MLEYLIHLPYNLLGHSILGFLELIDLIQYENAAASHKYFLITHLSCFPIHLIKSN